MQGTWEKYNEKVMTEKEGEEIRGLEEDTVRVKKHRTSEIIQVRAPKRSRLEHAEVNHVPCPEDALPVETECGPSIPVPVQQNLVLAPEEMTHQGQGGDGVDDEEEQEGGREAEIGGGDEPSRVSRDDSNYCNLSTTIVDESVCKSVTTRDRSGESGDKISCESVTTKIRYTQSDVRNYLSYDMPRKCSISLAQPEIPLNRIASRGRFNIKHKFKSTHMRSLSKHGKTKLDSGGNQLMRMFFNQIQGDSHDGYESEYNQEFYVKFEDWQQADIQRTEDREFLELINIFRDYNSN